MGRKSYRQKQKELRMSWSRNAVAAKARKRLDEAEHAVEVGRITFAGPMFGGDHVLRLMHRGEDRQVMLEIDGQPHRPRTMRGVRAMLAERILR